MAYIIYAVNTHVPLLLDKCLSLLRARQKARIPAMKGSAYYVRTYVESCVIACYYHVNPIGRLLLKKIQAFD